MTIYYPTIGLEIHAELNTKSKMWCGCPNDPDNSAPNTRICPVCTAQPGVLPVPNKEAITQVIRVGLAVNGEIADFTEFDRKNYFYPDMPKAYQLSQYKFPIVSGGEINGIKLTRIHLEEDTAKSSHGDDGATLIDFNRSGVPLMELVTEPVIHDSKAAGNFARELQKILRYLGASHANMEMGHMRVEANISISKDPNVFGTKVEVKNINSFTAVEQAIEYEIKRHTEVLEEGGEIVQETRGWDDTKQITVSQRKKENANDYRYFPDPDLPKMYLHKAFDLNLLKSTLPMLPGEAKTKLSNIGIPDDAIEILREDKDIVNYIVGISDNNEVVKLSANYLVADIFGSLKKSGKELVVANFPTQSSLRQLSELLLSNTLSSRGAKDILPFIMGQLEVDVLAIAKEKGFIQNNDTESLRTIVKNVLARSQSQVADYKAGKEQMFMYFVGQCMKEAKGSGNPGLFQEIIREELGK